MRTQSLFGADALVRCMLRVGDEAAEMRKQAHDSGAFIIVDRGPSRDEEALVLWAPWEPGGGPFLYYFFNVW